MWIFYALLSAFFAGTTSILAKIGIRHVNSTLATALRTIVVLVFAWVMVLIVGSQNGLLSLRPETWLFLVFSGLATGASWLCYFKALQLGEVNKVAALDKSSVVLTLILALILLGEPLSFLKSAAILLIAVGTLLMIQKQPIDREAKTRSWILYALLSAVFASLTTILGKVGIDGVEANLGTAIRTTVVLVMSWLVVSMTSQQVPLKEIDRKELTFIFFSGLATGASWLFYYRALQDGVTSAVVSIDKLSIVVTVGFSYFMFGEKLTTKALLGLVLIIAGTFGIMLG